MTCDHRAIGWGVFGLLLVLPPAGWGQEPAANPHVVRLIDQLTEVNEEGTGFHGTDASSEFLGVDMEPEFLGGVIGSTRPTTPPALRDLVRLGVVALPDLIAHLSDARPTRVRVRGYDGMWHSDEYDPRELPSSRLQHEPGPRVPDATHRRKPHGMCASTR